jgi:uncharacterized membrane protein YgdD (TMEM256/DUF423 family)
MKKNSHWIIISGLVGFLGVAIGAFGGHGLKQLVNEQMQEIFKTGVLYHLIHSAVILAIALSHSKLIEKAILFFLIGIILFSFSLYIYALTGLKFLTMLTPIGGIFFLIGWGMIIYFGLKEKDKQSQS